MAAITDPRHAAALLARYDGLNRCGHCTRRETSVDRLQLDSTYTWSCYQCFVPAKRDPEELDFVPAPVTSDDCPDCGHNGLDDHDQRDTPPSCLIGGCLCGDRSTLCRCGHPVACHQTGEGAWSGFCYFDTDCTCERPTNDWLAD